MTDKPQPRPFYKPLRPGARLFWVVVTLAGFAWCIHSFAAFLAA